SSFQRPASRPRESLGVLALNTAPQQRPATHEVFALFPTEHARGKRAADGKACLVQRAWGRAVDLWSIPRNSTIIGAGRTRIVIARLPQALIYFFTGRTNRELIRITARNPDFATQGNHGFTRERRGHDLLFTHVVRIALMIARFE